MSSRGWRGDLRAGRVVLPAWAHVRPHRQHQRPAPAHEILVTPTGSSLGRLDPDALSSIDQNGDPPRRRQALQGSVPARGGLPGPTRRRSRRPPAQHPLGRRVLPRRPGSRRRPAAADRLLRDARRPATPAALPRPRRRFARAARRESRGRPPRVPARQPRSRCRRPGPGLGRRRRSRSWKRPPACSCCSEGSRTRPLTTDQVETCTGGTRGDHDRHRPANRFGTDILTALDVPDSDASLVSDSLVTADMWGHPSHGMLRLPGTSPGCVRAPCMRSPNLSRH